MKWIKKGLIFSPEKKFGWMSSHAQVPTLLLKEDCLRIYFSTRPKPGLSLTTFLDVDKNDLSKIIYIHNKPILELGEPGMFDEHGIMPSSVIEKDGLVLMYYSGWQKSIGVPYNNYTGLAISEDGGITFSRYKKGPVLDRTPDETFSCTSPTVFFENNLYHMWYSSGTDWIKINDKFEHTYDIKYAYSQDGYKWIQDGTVAIAQKNKFEAICKPAIVKLSDVYYMWYGYRGSKDFRNGNEGYQIGFAVSKNLKTWERNDNGAGIQLSFEGWDSQMMAYPAIIKIENQHIMVYNGNYFGKEGFGYAILTIK